MYPTNYHRAFSLDEALALFEKSDNPKFIAGGQTLLPTMKQRLADPADLIDLRHIDTLKGIAIKDDEITIGSATTHSEVASSNELRKACPAVCDLAAAIGDPAVRHMGTIGGSVANNDPAADYPAALIALDAEITTSQRTIRADDFFIGLFETALEENEIITGIAFRAPEKAAYVKHPNPASRYAMAGVFVARSGDGNVRVGITGAGADGVFRHREMESALTKSWLPEAIANCPLDPEELLSDIHGDNEYRANLVMVMAKRAVTAAG